MSDFTQDIEKLLQNIVKKAKEDHSANAPPDATFILKPVVPEEVDQTKIDEVLSQLSVVAGTKNGLAKVITLLNLVVKYASKI